MIQRSAEAEAFLTTIDVTNPAAVSACDGWTTHEIAAHVAGIAVEVIRHLEPYLQGDPVPQTRSFEEREAPLQRTGHGALLARLDAEEQRMRALVADVLAREPDAVIPWTGRQMAVAKFVPHLRNEHALHRWDIAGDDEISRNLLGNVELVDHSISELGRVLLVAGRKTIRRRIPIFTSGCARQVNAICGWWSRTARRPWRGPKLRLTNPCWNSTPVPGSCSSGAGVPTIAAG